MTRTFSRRTALYGSAAMLAGLAGCSTGGESGEPSRTDSTSAGHSTGPLAYASTESAPTGIDLRGNPVLGDPAAPVDMYYWSDFQCPFCHRFEQNAAPKLVENELADGTLRMVVLELPKIGDDSMTAALLAKCVWRQVKDTRPDAYHRWHSTVYDNQGDPNSGWASRENLHALTESVDGVDASAMHSCLDTRRESMRRSVEADVDQAAAHDVSATPGFVLYGRESGKRQKLTGAQPYPRFEAEIERLA